MIITKKHGANTRTHLNHAAGEGPGEVHVSIVDVFEQGITHDQLFAFKRKSTTKNKNKIKASKRGRDL